MMRPRIPESRFKLTGVAALVGCLSFIGAIAAYAVVISLVLMMFLNYMSGFFHGPHFTFLNTLLIYVGLNIIVNIFRRPAAVQNAK